MPQVITKPIGQSNGDQVIEFIDAVGPTKTDYAFTTKQNSITITNNGSGPVDVTVNSTTKTLNQYEAYSVTADFTKFSAQSKTSGTNQINVRTVVFATLNIKDGSISGADLADKSVTDDKLANPKVDVPAGIQPKMVLGTTLSTSVIGMVGYSQDPMADQLAMYNFGGQLKTAAPAEDNDAATKKYVDDQVKGKLTATQAAAMANSTATDVAGVVADLNTLLANLRASGIQKT